MREHGMGALLSVAAGSAEPPALICATYRNAPNNPETMAFLGKGNLGWRVLNLQARGDVPDADEVAQLRASLPPDYPLNIVNKFWRDLLIGARRSN